MLDAEELLSDERFDTAAKRRQRKTQLTQLVDERLQGRDREALLEALHVEQVPCAPVTKPSDPQDDPGLDATELLAEFTLPDDSSESPLQTVLTPVIGERFGPSHRFDPPALGEHTEAVLAGTGLSESTTQALQERGAFGA